MRRLQLLHPRAVQQEHVQRALPLLDRLARGGNAMTQMNATKRLAREIQRRDAVPYMVALNQARVIIAEKRTEGTGQES